MRTYSIIILVLIGLISFAPLHAFAYGAMFDGGELQGMSATCSCSGGETINVNSYVDNSTHTYLYQPGLTQLYKNYNIMSSNAYFLTTLVPFAVCLDAADDCEGSEGEQPEGIFLLTGTSFNEEGMKIMALLGKFPTLKKLSQTFSISNFSPAVGRSQTNL